MTMNRPELVSTMPLPLPTGLLAQLGEAVASAAHRVQDGWPSPPPAALAELAQLEQLGLQLQEAVRVLAAPPQAGAERVDLAVAALQARAEWAAVLQRHETPWIGPTQGAEVWANPSLIKQMLDLALGHVLDHALGPAPGLGSRLTVEVVRVVARPLAQLRITVSHESGALFDSQPGDAAQWHWVLLRALAAHAGLAVERQVLARGLELLLTWPQADAAGQPRAAA
jgi:hypothetical protein